MLLFKIIFYHGDKNVSFPRACLLLRSAVGMAHVLRSRLVMGYATSSYPCPGPCAILNGPLMGPISTGSFQDVLNN